MVITIKRLVSKDISSLYKVGLQEFKGEYWYTKAFLKESFSAAKYSYGAFENNKLIGGIIVAKQDKPKLWIYFFVVDKNQRGKGIGGRLLKTVEQKSPKGFYLMVVDVGEKDKIANNFYQKYGFQKQARIKDWFGKNHNAFIYSKKL